MVTPEKRQIRNVPATPTGTTSAESPASSEPEPYVTECPSCRAAILWDLSDRSESSNESKGWSGEMISAPRPGHLMIAEGRDPRDLVDPRQGYASKSPNEARIKLCPDSSQRGQDTIKTFLRFLIHLCHLNQKFSSRAS